MRENRPTVEGMQPDELDEWYESLDDLQHRAGTIRSRTS